MRNLRIAVGGSCCDPPHNGHFAILQHMLSLKDKFDIIMWIPSGKRSDKENDENVSPDDKVMMTELMIDPNWRVSIPQLIIRYDEVYGKALTTYERLAKLKQEYPEGTEFTWFTGSDTNILTWYQGMYLVMNENFYIIKREGFSNIYDGKFFREFHKDNITLADVEISGPSSSSIRTRILNGLEFEDMVPPGVSLYIKQNELYGYSKNRF